MVTKAKLTSAFSTLLSYQVSYYLSKNFAFLNNATTSEILTPSYPNVMESSAGRKGEAYYGDYLHNLDQLISFFQDFKDLLKYPLNSLYDVQLVRNKPLKKILGSASVARPRANITTIHNNAYLDWRSVAELTSFSNFWNKRNPRALLVTSFSRMSHIYIPNKRLTVDQTPERPKLTQNSHRSLIIPSVSAAVS